MSYKIKTLVLKKLVTDQDVYLLIQGKKGAYFRSLFSRTAKKDIHIESNKVNYECVVMISGRYTADYFRHVTHTLSVSGNVREIVFGDGVFPARSRSNIGKQILGKMGKNKIDLPLEEHVFIDESDSMYIDHTGNETKPSFKTDSQENYPDRILKDDSHNIVRPCLDTAQMIEKLTEKLRPKLEEQIRDLCEHTEVSEILQIYVPRFEIVLSGPKNKTVTVRIDAINGKIIK